MSSLTLAAATSRTRSEALRAAAVALAVGLAGMALLFNEEIAAAVHVWLGSTAYNHCFLVLPIAAFLAYERRERLAVTPVAPAPLLALGVIPLGLVWLVAERLGIMEGRQLLVIAMLELLVAAVAGWRLWRAFAAPLLYLVFLVPFGAFITPELQAFTAKFTTTGLDLLNIPNYVTGNTIEIPQGTFYIAEACAGLRFLIASVAFGALYAIMMYRTAGRRIAFIAISVVVPVIANGFRALGIVTLGNILGSAKAAATDHVLYGWIFFSIVILLLTVLGLPFRQDMARPPAHPAGVLRPVALRRTLAAALATLLLMALAPGAAMALSRSRPALAALPPLPLAGCTAGPAPGGAVQAPQAVGARTRVVCAGQAVLVDVLAFSPRAGASAVLGTQRRLTSSLAAEDSTSVGLTEPGWRLVELRDPFAAHADALWVDGGPAAGGLGLRLALARASFLGAADAPVLIAVTPEIDWAHPGGEAGLEQARAAVERFLAATPGLPGYARALGRMAARGG